MDVSPISCYNIALYVQPLPHLHNTSSQQRSHNSSDRKRKIISTENLIKLAKRWRRFAAASRKRISLPGSNDTKSSLTVEKGHQFVIYTADERQFVLPLAFLGSQLVQQLLRMAEEEFRLAGDRPITLPCDSDFMEYMTSIIRHRATIELEEASILSLSN